MRQTDSEFQQIKNEVRQLQEYFGAVNTLQGRAPFPKPKKYSHFGQDIQKELLTSKTQNNGQ